MKDNWTLLLHAAFEILSRDERFQLIRYLFKQFWSVLLLLPSSILCFGFISILLFSPLTKLQQRKKEKTFSPKKSFLYKKTLRTLRQKILSKTQKVDFPQKSFFFLWPLLWNGLPPTKLFFQKSFVFHIWPLFWTWVGREPVTNTLEGDVLTNVLPTQTYRKWRSGPISASSKEVVSLNPDCSTNC